MIFLLYALILTVVECAYVVCARHYGLVEKKISDSVDPAGAARSGGIVFTLAACAGGLMSPGPPWLFLGALVLLALTGLVDDFHPLRILPRLCCQTLCMILLLIQLAPAGLTFAAAAIAVVVGVGIINCYNFMDGINGITAAYSLAVLLPLAWLNSRYGFASPQLVYMTMAGVVAFGLFNFRRRALCFAGDAGSTAMAFIILYLVGRLMLTTGEWWWIGLLTVYGVDTVLTICRRIAMRENIFTPHHHHLYQILAERHGISHLTIAGAYAAVQLAIAAILIWRPLPPAILLTVAILLSAATYRLGVRR